jgi:hypothetical protein
MLEINESTLTGVVRAEVSLARDNGEAIDAYLVLWLAVADLLRLPDDTMFVPAVAAAMATPTRLDDPASLAYTANLARIAGYGKLAADHGHS